MNPLIQKFWNDAGYEIVLVLPGSNPTTGDFQWRYWWTLKKDGVYFGTAAISEKLDMISSREEKNIKCLFYYFNGQEYLEEDMLKIVKMKAFI